MVNHVRASKKTRQRRTCVSAASSAGSGTGLCMVAPQLEKKPGHRAGPGATVLAGSYAQPRSLCREGVRPPRGCSGRALDAGDALVLGKPAGIGVWGGLGRVRVALWNPSHLKFA